MLSQRTHRTGARQLLPWLALMLWIVARDAGARDAGTQYSSPVATGEIGIVSPYLSEGPEWGVVNVAHRGGIAPGEPENTLGAFRRAIAAGADAIEIDLRGTRDGRVVVLHDETLERTTDGTGRVTDYELSELRRLDAGDGAKIPTYEEVLELVSGTGVQLLLDIKVSPVLDKRRVVRLTESHRAVLHVIVGARTVADRST